MNIINLKLTWLLDSCVKYWIRSKRSSKSHPIRSSIASSITFKKYANTTMSCFIMMNVSMDSTYCVAWFHPLRGVGTIGGAPLSYSEMKCKFTRPLLLLLLSILLMLLGGGCGRRARRLLILHLLPIPFSLSSPLFPLFCNHLIGVTLCPYATPLDSTIGY